jgi:hypothetical protein
MSEQPSIATGAPLNADTWADFVQRLRHDCVGEGVRDHYTADAIFLVQARRYTYGIDNDYGGETVACVEDSIYTSPSDFYERELDDNGRRSLDAEATEHGSPNFLSLSTWMQWELIGVLDGVTVTGRRSYWQYVCAHFTKDAAEAFIRRKAHDYSDGLRVYVEAQSYSWEYNAIKAAILDGRLTFAAASIGPTP